MLNKIIIGSNSLVGKDTVADYLVDKYGFVKFSFATGIYEICEKYFSMKNKNRKLLQDVGEALRAVDPKVWINYTFNKAEQYDKVVICDMRQSLEYIESHLRGYTPIRIISDHDIKVQRAIERDGSYPDTSLWFRDTETGCDSIPMLTIENNCSLNDLYNLIDDFVNEKENNKLKYGIYQEGELIEV